MNNLYENNDEFRLTTSTGTHTVREPVGWDKVNFILKRDATYHGVDFEFSDGSIQLSFTEVAGWSLILADLKKFGNDANVLLQFGPVIGNVFYPDYEGYLDFNSPYKKTYNSFDCSVKRKTLDDKIQTRFETPVTLTSQKTIDNSLMPEMNSITLPLHSKAIIEKFIRGTGESAGGADEHILTPFADRSGSDASHDFYVYPNLSKASTNEIRDIGGATFGIYHENPLDISNYTWNIKSNSNFSFSIKLWLRFHFYLTPQTFGSGTIDDYSFEYNLVVVTPSGTRTTHQIGNPLRSNIHSKELDFYWKGELVKNIPLSEGDKVYLFGKFTYDGNGKWKQVNPEIWMLNTEMYISGETQSSPTSTTAYLIHETVDRVIKSISDNAGYLKSDFLGRPDLGYTAMGAGAKKVITSGYQIRNFSKEERPVIVSLKDLIESINAMHCIGAAYEMDDTGKYYYRLERFDYFYRDVEILTISEPSDYYEELDLDFVFNEIEIGYSKYPEDDVTTLDEFNTKHQYITPIISYKKKLSQLSKLITSGYAIELTRRKKFEETESDSWKYDEDNFAITVRQNGAAWVPEKDEAFVSPVTGVISPETSYNIRLSPKRMLQAWAKLLNTGLVFKRSVDLVKNTFFSKNGDLTTQFNSSETANIGDPDKLVTVEKSDVMLGELDRFDRIFAPEKINFKTSLNIDQINFIKRCLQNRDTGGRNYGYIRVKDNDGNYQVGYLLNMQYNPVSEMTTLVLRKKYANLGNQFDCTAYSDWKFSQFEAATGLSPEIEQCKFNDFN